MEEMITITKTHYDNMKKEIARLQKDSMVLQYLESYGVDNWSGFDDAMSEYHNDFPE